MDLDTTNQQVTTPSQNTSPEPVVNTPGPNQKRFIPAIVGVMFLLIVVAGGAYYLGTKNNYPLIKNQSEQAERVVRPTQTPTVTKNEVNPTKNGAGTEIISLDRKTSKYINHDLGFSIKYPSYNQTPSTCAERQTDKNGTVPLKVYEVPNQNSFFISEATYIAVKEKQVSGGGWQYDFSTCKVMQNSLNLITNGFDNGMPDTDGMHINISKPNALQINYQKVNNDTDLQSLAQTLYKGCYIGDKQLVKNSSGVYQVKLVAKNGQNNDPESGCFTNFVYLFQYSPKNHIAVITSGYQNSPFNGTNGQYEPEIDFP